MKSPFIKKHFRMCVHQGRVNIFIQIVRLNKHECISVFYRCRHKLHSFFRFVKNMQFLRICMIKQGMRLSPINKVCDNEIV